MRVLITGGTGVVGAHLVRRFLREGFAVAVLMRPGSNPWRIADVLGDISVIPGDLTAVAEAAGRIRSFAPDVMMHLAWHGALTFRQQDDPAQVFQNIGGSLELVRLAGEMQCRRWVGLGTAMEYGQFAVPQSEDLVPRPTSLYGTAKYSVSLLAERLCRAYGIGFSWVRPFYAYGPGDDPVRLIPYVIDTLLRGERPALSPGGQKWDYLYLTDLAEALFRIATASGAEGVLNVGSGEAYTIRLIVEMIRDLIDPSLCLGFGEVAYRPGQIMHLQADITKLRAATGWQPQVSLADGLRQTVDWHRSCSRRSLACG
jgi:nucleoside-diphosphate-sugar epimerase